MSAEGDVSVGAAAALNVGVYTGNPWIVGAAVVWLIGDYLWNYYHQADDPAPPHTNLNLPTVAEGSVVPIIYGFVNVSQPVMAWLGEVIETETSPGNWMFGFNTVFVLGSSFQTSSVRITDIRFGGAPTNATPSAGITPQFTDNGNQRGFGGFEIQIIYALNDNTRDNKSIAGFAQILNGRPGQVNVLGSVAQNWVGHTLLDGGLSASHVPTYRNVISVVFRGQFGDFPSTANWSDSASIPGTSFILLCKPADYQGLVARVNSDTELGCNPIDVLYDILTGSFNKLALPPSQLALSEFIAAAQTCWDENILYSRVVDQATKAEDLIGELMQHVNGILYEDMSDGLLHLKLLRADYITTSLRTIDPTNCVALDSFQISTWSEVPNMVTVRYTDPVTGSQQSVSQSSQATAVGQDGTVQELILSFPGCVSRDQALTMAARELQIRSRPIMKCRVMTTREFDDLKPGDAVYLSWPKLNISSIVFRVLNLTSGVLNDGKITINLVQDVFYVHKKHPPFPIGDIGDPTWEISF